jgi:predicted MFS family arabinose efflux permease
LFNERLIVFLVGAVQFVNILDFVMVMPLGPDFAKALDIPASHLGYIGGAYTLAAAFSGLAGSFFLDRFDRRKALAVAMLGLGIGTACGGLAWDLPSLLAARVIAGLFGGPATSLSFSIIADVIPSERRGKAMGAVMGAFSVASIVGIPAGLRLARIGTWRLPFFGTAVLGLMVTAMSIWLLPPLTGHLRDPSARETTIGALLRKPRVQLSYAMTAIVMAAGFIVIPNISPYVQGNLAFPREQLELLYLWGGAVSFLATRLGGMLVDRFGSFRVGVVGALLVLAINYLWFIDYRPSYPMVAMMAGFMFAMGIRNVAYNTLTSKVPSPAERARFQSLQSAVQHGFAALASIVGAKLLDANPDGSIVGMQLVASISMGMSLLFPVLAYYVERGLTSDRAEVVDGHVAAGDQPK